MGGVGRLRVPAMSRDPATVDDGLHLVKVDDKVRFDSEKQLYTVRSISADRRWVICTKPFNPQRTVIYCILDRVEQRRGPDDRVFGMGYETPEDIAQAMALLEAGMAADTGDRIRRLATDVLTRKEPRVV